MAPIVLFLVHHGRRECAWFFGGDERFRIEVPSGWQQIIPRTAITNEAEFDEWLQLDLYGRLHRLCPPGYTVVGELK